MTCSKRDRLHSSPSQQRSLLKNFMLLMGVLLHLFECLACLSFRSRWDWDCLMLVRSHDSPAEQFSYRRWGLRHRLRLCWNSGSISPNGGNQLLLLPAYLRQHHLQLLLAVHQNQHSASPLGLLARSSLAMCLRRQRATASAAIGVSCCSLVLDAQYGLADWGSL